LVIVLLALLIDLVFGDPPNKYHPTAWMGKLAEFARPHLRNKNRKIEKFNGVLFAIVMICTFSIPVYLGLSLIQRYAGLMVYVVTAAVILKLTFAVKGMRSASLEVTTALEKGDIREARRNLSRIVRRDTSKLDQELVLSGTVESIAESTVDGITSALFYFAMFGVPGAVAYRTVNTLDSVVGYKDPKHINVGWFPAKLDSLLNFIPARLTAGLMVIAASLRKENRENSWRMMRRDRGKTASINAGWPMSAMAGALCIRLKKRGHYTLGENDEVLCPCHVSRALGIMMTTAILFLIFVVAPVCLVKGLW
jgi:adenosylcobinamide-phosphate synthase